MSFAVSKTVTSFNSNCANNAIADAETIETTGLGEIETRGLASRPQLLPAYEMSGWGIWSPEEGALPPGDLERAFPRQG